MSWRDKEEEELCYQCEVSLSEDYQFLDDIEDLPTRYFFCSTKCLDQFCEDVAYLEA